MLLPRRTLRSTKLKADATACLSCQWRLFSSSYRSLSEKEVRPDSAPPPRTVLDEVPRASGKAVKEFTPKPLDRPIGLPKPPRAGENVGIDKRTWKQRRDDFVNYDKHLVKRKEL